MAMRRFERTRFRTKKSSTRNTTCVWGLGFGM
jgi:hypothetical protein